MEFEIGQEFMELADRCGRDQRCLKGILCPQEVLLIGAKRFICRDPDPCAYKFPFGHNFFCTCPVRREIYNKYGK